LAKAKSKPDPGRGKGALLWGCVFVLGGGWLFFLGVMVGRGLVPLPFEPDALEGELAAQRIEETAIAEARLKQEAQEGLPEEPLRIQDLRQPQVDTQVRAIPRVNVTGPDGVPLKKRRVPAKKRPLPKVQRPARTTVPSRGAAPAAPQADKIPEAEGGSAPPAPPIKADSVAAALAGMKAKYTLQVASVREQAAAERIVKKLQQAGLPAYQTASPSGSGRGWYRVRVGAYETRQAAQAALDKFKDSRYKPIIIQR
jgi:cell division protein FtsN